MSVGFSSHLTEYLSWSPPLSQELQCGPGDGQSDGETLWFRPHIHHGEDHLCLFPSSAGRTAVPPQPQGGGSHAQVQTPGQVSGKWLSMYLLYLREVYLCHSNRGIFTLPVHFPSSVIQSVWAEAWHHPFKPKGRAWLCTILCVYVASCFAAELLKTRLHHQRLKSLSLSGSWLRLARYARSSSG